jgi:hypothetical protein
MDKQQKGSAPLQKKRYSHKKKPLSVKYQRLRLKYLRQRHVVKLLSAKEDLLCQLLEDCKYEGCTHVKEELICTNVWCGNVVVSPCEADLCGDDEGCVICTKKPLDHCTTCDKLLCKECVAVSSLCDQCADTLLKNNKKIYEYFSW